MKMKVLGDLPPQNGRPNKCSISYVRGSHPRARRDGRYRFSTLNPRGGGPNRPTESRWFSQRIEDIEARKVLFIVRYNHALVCFGDGSDNHIQITSGFPGSATFRHETSPDQCRFFVKRQYSAFE